MSVDFFHLVPLTSGNEKDTPHIDALFFLFAF